MTHARLDLGGSWRASVADDELRRVYAADDFDDADWPALSVPGHWQRSEAFPEHDGPLLLRRRLETPASPTGGTRWWLRFDGIFYQSDVWLDGAYLGDTEGYFSPHQFEVTEQLAERSEHVLAVEVACTPQRDKTRKRNLTGSYQHSDSIDARLNPGGIWAPVGIVASGPVRIVHHRVLCLDADPTRSTVGCRLVLDATDDLDVVIITRVAGIDHRHARKVAAGENQFEWTVVVPDPELWWPHALGDAVLHDLEIEVVLDDRVSDSVTHRIGLRSVELENWILRVNGERLFLKGANQGPVSCWPSETTPMDHDRDVALARDAGLDLLRIHSHIAAPALYDAADRAGMLLWQDLPLQWAYHRTVRPQAVRQARLAVDLLGHHPSIAVWCGHSSPVPLSIEPDDVATPEGRRRLLARNVSAQELPTYNRTILDRSIARTLRRNDPSRPVVPHSGVLPHLPRLDGTDSHLYLGWYGGEEWQFPALCAAWPRLVRFVSEFGAQSVPVDADFVDAADWPNLDWEELGERHRAQRGVFERYVPPEAFGTFEEWAAATRRYQADLVRFHVETLRRLKYSPTGGFAVFAFADATPGITWSLLSADRVPKDAYGALRAVCAPVIATADRLPDHVHPGEPIEVQVHVVSDLRHELDDVRVVARWSWDGGGHVEGFEGAVEADGCVLVGTSGIHAPEEDGPVELALELSYGDVVTTRTDRTFVVGGEHHHH